MINYHIVGLVPHALVHVVPGRGYSCAGLLRQHRPDNARTRTIIRVGQGRINHVIFGTEYTFPEEGITFTPGKHVGKKSTTVCSLPKSAPSSGNFLELPPDSFNVSFDLPLCVVKLVASFTDRQRLL